MRRRGKESKTFDIIKAFCAENSEIKKQGEIHLVFQGMLLIHGFRRLDKKALNRFFIFLRMKF